MLMEDVHNHLFIISILHDVRALVVSATGVIAGLEYSS